jgi:hypothetical protein
MRVRKKAITGAILKVLVENEHTGIEKIDKNKRRI